jgi:hypothetical protein
MISLGYEPRSSARSHHPDHGAKGEIAMKKREVIAVIVENRDQTAGNVQKILTGWGCMIKTRLGLHDGVLDNCTQTGLIILEMVGADEKLEEFIHKINLLKGAQAKRITLQLPE